MLLIPCGDSPFSPFAQDYYQILGVPRGADTKEMKKAYRQLARTYHPVSGVQGMSELIAAHRHLKYLAWLEFCKMRSV
jgi:DnaJ-domain-containing protein 1